MHGCRLLIIGMAALLCACATEPNPYANLAQEMAKTHVDQHWPERRWFGPYATLTRDVPIKYDETGGAKITRPGGKIGVTAKKIGRYEQTAVFWAPDIDVAAVGFADWEFEMSITIVHRPSGDTREAGAVHFTSQRDLLVIDDVPTLVREDGFHGLAEAPAGVVVYRDS